MTSIDVALLVMVLIWGANFSLVKVAMRDFPEFAFNASRLIVASTVFIAAMAIKRELPTRVPRRDWIHLAIVGVIGTGFYQLFFLAGVRRTSVGNASLITGSSPVVIAILTAMLGHERIPLLRWIGVALAMFGLYFVVGHDVRLSGSTLAGDGLVLAAMLCWAIYSVATRPLLSRYSALMVTGVSFMSGTVLYIVVTLPILIRTQWASISSGAWLAMIASGTLALSVSYVIWYYAIQKLGSTRATVYNYLTPVVAMITAAIWLAEPVQFNQVLGAGAILAGLAITRLAH